MIRIVNEHLEPIKATPEELLRMHHAGVPLVALQGVTGTGLRVKAHDLGNGHTEVTGTAPTVWRPLEWNSTAMDCYLTNAVKEREEGEEERKQKALTIAANRAKVKVRKYCKILGADTLLTLTYRDNEQDLARTKKDLKEFVRRLRKLLPDFSAVAVYEQQERGAYHWHIATAGMPVAFTKTAQDGHTYRVKSFDALRAVWRSVTGERGGNIDLARRKSNSQRSPAKIASYIAKYIVKAFIDGEAFSNRYSVFGELKVPRPVEIGYYPNMAEAVAACYACVLDEQVVVLQHLSRWHDWFCLFVEAPPKKKGPRLAG
jgi:hypothetical protein